GPRDRNRGHRRCRGLGTRPVGPRLAPGEQRGARRLRADGIPGGGRLGRVGAPPVRRSDASTDPGGTWPGGVSLRDMRSREDVRVLARRYSLREEIARGGMGVVWRAEDTLLGRPVAVKEVFPPNERPGADGQSAGRRRGLREARAAAALHHPGIVTVFDIVREDGRSFIVMELLD